LLVVKVVIFASRDIARGILEDGVASVEKGFFN
jgi:hypothetical protein